MFVLVVGVTAAVVTCCAASHERGVGPAGPTGILWAGLSAERPVLELGGTRQPLTFTFALVNDSASSVNPEIDRAKLVINDREWPDSSMMFGNGPWDDRFERLAAGDTLLFGYALDSVFKEPGVYRVAWRGPGYESAAVTIRVLPARLTAP